MQTFTRRHLLAGGLALPGLARAQKTAGVGPNVVLVLAEGLPAFMLGCYGNREVRTPHVDQLARTGVRFTNNIVASPAPGPSRAALLTGRTVMQLGGAQAVPPGTASLNGILAEKGYTREDAQNDDALKFLEAQSAGKPFCLTAVFTDLQPPYNRVPENFQKLYAQTRFETFPPPDPVSPAAIDPNKFLANRISSLRQAAAAVSALDARLGAVVATLTKKGLLDNTLLVFTSPAGFLFGRHGIWGAGDGSEPPNAYEEVVNTPMIWRWPMRIPPQTTRTELVSGHDFLPSIAEAVSAQFPINLSGRSYFQVAMGKSPSGRSSWRNTAFANYKDVFMMRDTRYKLILRNSGNGPNELFDLQSDRAERENQYDSPRYASVRPAMTAEIEVWKNRWAQPTA